VEDLLGGEVEVEPVLEPVQLELARGEEVPGGLGDNRGGSELLGLLLESLLELLLPGGRGGGGGKGGWVPVRGVEGVDERVDSGTVGARGDNAGLVGAASEVATVPVEVEVPVGWVVGVDEGVGVGRGNGPPHGLLGLSHTLDGLGRHKGLLGRSLLGLLVESWAGLGHGTIVVFVIVVNRFPGLDKLLLLLRLLLLDKLLTRSRGRARGGLELGRGLAVGAGGHVVALQDPEPVLASGVSHSDGLARLVDVAVLANPLAVGSRLLPVNCSVLLGIGRSKPAVSSIEPLLLEDLGLLRVDKLGEGGRSKAGGENKLKHDDGWEMHSSDTSSWSQLRCGQCTTPIHRHA